MQLLILVLFFRCIYGLFYEKKENKEISVDSVIHMKENVPSELTCLHICLRMNGDALYTKKTCRCVGEINFISNNAPLITGTYIKKNPKTKKSQGNTYKFGIPQRMVGNWSITYANANDFKSAFAINPDNTVYLKSRNRKQDIIKSDNQDEFPSTQGWVLVKRLYNEQSWEYIRLRSDGTLELHYFCIGHVCESMFDGLSNYCCSGIGLKGVQIGPIQLRQGKQIATISKMMKVFHIQATFKIDPLTLKNKWQNILCITRSMENNRNLGNRHPSILLRKKGTEEDTFIFSLDWADAQNNNLQAKKNLSFLDSDFKIDYIQEERSEEFAVRILINDIELVNQINSHPREFENLLVYASDPWHNAVENGIITVRFIEGVELK